MTLRFARYALLRHIDRVGIQPRPAFAIALQAVDTPLGDSLAQRPQPAHGDSAVADEVQLCVAACVGDERERAVAQARTIADPPALAAALGVEQQLRAVAVE